MGESSEKEPAAWGGLLTLNPNDDDTIQPISTEALTSTSEVSLYVPPAPIRPSEP